MELRPEVLEALARHPAGKYGLLTTPLKLYRELHDRKKARQGCQEPCACGVCQMTLDLFQELGLNSPDAPEVIGELERNPEKREEFFRLLETIK